MTEAPDGDPRTLGVLGTLVWDSIHHRDVRSEPLEEWGGIGYALEALNVLLPEGWRVRPLIQVGEDLAEEAFAFLGELERVQVAPGIRVVPEPNNRVELRYQGQVRQTERLTGGVPPWSWSALEPFLDGCDALYVNFISGFEMELETALRIKTAFDGPIYADLHSLFLGIGRHGDRIPRPLPHWAEWLHSFDVVQMNESEFELLGHTHGDPWRLAAEAVGADLKLISVTMGPRGAAYVASPAFSPEPFSWPEGRGRMAVPGAARSGRVEVELELRSGDPTGCGDVWGATCFARLLSGDSLEGAMGEANRMAARNVQHLGARGLGLHLMGRVDPGVARS